MKKTDSTKLDQIIAMLGDMSASMERSFAAVADDIADIKRDLATKDEKSKTSAQSWPRSAATLSA